MARIIIVNNPLNPADLVEREWVGPYCSDDGKSGFLNVFYPEGFPGTHRTVLNRQLLAVEDYDVVLGPEDEVVLMVAPGIGAIIAGATAIGSALASSAVLTSLVVGLALTAVSYMLAPKVGLPSTPETPASLARPKADSVYNLAVPTNQTRLGDPIPVAYGRNLLTPDYIAEPYGRYVENEQIVHMLMCLGQGEFEIHDVFLSDTPVSSFSRQVLNYKVYPPALHQKQIGIIAKDFDVQENAFVSDEVSNIELKPNFRVLPLTAVVTAADVLTLSAPDPNIIVGMALQVGGTSYTVQSVSGQNISVSPSTLTDPALVYNGTNRNPKYSYDGTLLRFNTVDSPLLEASFGGRSVYSGKINFIAAGVSYEAVGTVKVNLNTIDLDVASLTPAGLPTTPTLGVFEPIGDLFTVYAETQVGDTVSFSYSNQLNDLSFVVCNENQTVDNIQFDYVFPSGLFDTDVNTGGFIERTIDLEFVIIEIDNAGNDLVGGNIVTQSKSLTRADNTPLRISDIITVPRGRYRATMRRLTPEITDRNTVQDQVNWAGLIGYDGSKFGSYGYGEVTLLAIKAQATNALNGSALNRISVLATRKLNGVPTTSADEAFRDIVTNILYGAARPVTEIDGNLTGDFNAVFDFDSTVWEAANIVVQAVDGNLTPLANTFKVRMGDPSTIPRMRFKEGVTTGGLIVDGTLVRTYALGNRSENDGVEVEYRDPISYQPAYALYPVNSVRPREVKLLGCTNVAIAFDRAKLIWNEEQYSRFTWSFESELDALVLEPGDTIEITPLDEQPVLCVVSEVEHKGQFSSSIVAFEYDARVYA